MLPPGGVASIRLPREEENLAQQVKSFLAYLIDRTVGRGTPDRQGGYPYLSDEKPLCKQKKKKKKHVPPQVARIPRKTNPTGYELLGKRKSVLIAKVSVLPYFGGRHNYRGSGLPLPHQFRVGGEGGDTSLVRKRPFGLWEKQEAYSSLAKKTKKAFLSR